MDELEELLERVTPENVHGGCDTGPRVGSEAPLDQLAAEALELPLPERAQLIQRLIESLDGEDDEDQGDVERAWDEEIARRVAELDAGTAELIPAEEVFGELRARLRESGPRPSVS